MAVGNSTSEAGLMGVLLALVPHEGDLTLRKVFPSCNLKSLGLNHRSSNPKA